MPTEDYVRTFLYTYEPLKLYTCATDDPPCSAGASFISLDSHAFDASPTSVAAFLGSFSES